MNMGFPNGDGTLDEIVAWAMTADMPASRSNLFVIEPSVAPLLAPGVPALGAYEPEERASGLTVAWRSRPAESGPLDLVRVHVTASEVTGKVVPLDEIREVLADLPVTSLMSYLSALTCHLEHRGPEDETFEAELVDAFCPDRWKPPVRDLLAAKNRALFSPQTTLALLRLAAGTCTSMDGQVSTQAVGWLVMALADHMSGELAGAHGTDDLALARLALFFYRDRPQNLWGRHEFLWREILPSLRSHPANVDASSALETEFGLDLETIEAAAMAVYLLFHGKVDNNEAIRHSLPLTGPKLDPALLSRFVDLISVRPAELRVSPDEPVAWDFTAMRRRPLIRLEDSIAPSSLRLLADVGTAGIFYLVEEAVRKTEGEGGTSRWRTFFGAIWEGYVRTALMNSVGDTERIIPEAHLQAAYPGLKLCDNVVLYPGTWLLVESVSRRMTLATIARGSGVDLERDLEVAVLKKARQLASTVEQLKTNPTALVPEASARGMRVIPVIVLPGPFPTITPVVARFRDVVSGDSACSSLNGADVEPLVVMDAADYEALLGTAEKNARMLPDLIRGWQSSDLFDATFYNWACLSGVSPAHAPRWLRDAANRYFDRCRSILLQA